MSAHPAAPPPGGRASIRLLHDGSLTLRIHPALAPLAASWIPILPDPSAAASAAHSSAASAPSAAHSSAASAPSAASAADDPREASAAHPSAGPSGESAAPASDHALKALTAHSSADPSRSADPPEECAAPARAVPSSAPARIRVVRLRGRPFALPQGEPTVEMQRVRAWLDEDAGRACLAAEDGHVCGVVDLARGRAVLGVHAAAPFSRQREEDLAYALTVAAALLLGRRGASGSAYPCRSPRDARSFMPGDAVQRTARALLHAGAVVAPDGRAWLLVGDSHSGKTTTCATLIRAGWEWLADDQVVLGVERNGTVRAEGWPRAFTLDEGYAAGTPRGRRAPADPAGLGPGRWRRSAQVGGVLLPRVQADAPTAMEPAHAAEVLGALIRQSPWLLADRMAAPAVLELLSQTARLPSYRLRAGLDSYGDTKLLQKIVADFVLP
ncbi:MAG TPA: hypothetical protein VHG93_00485 [Longimicrobium sp.]|nr:hypothetical protein [Longimicrobium sp.]